VTALTTIAAFALAPPEQITTSNESIVESGLTESDWLQAGAIVLGSIVIAVVASKVIRSVLGRALGRGFAAIITARVVAYTVFVVGLIYALTTLGVRVGPLLGALGLTGLVLALALQTVAENFIGGIVLQSRRPFTVGDTVDLDGKVGVVTDVDSRTVVMRGLDGSMIRVPNADVLSSPIVTLTREAVRRSEITVGVAYDTDLDRATEVLTEAVGRVDRVADSPDPWIVLREFGESSINFSVFFWHHSDVASELATTHDMVLAVHHALADAGITIAFPQMVLWPGHDADDNPYPGDPTTVRSERSTTPSPPESRSDAPLRGWLRRD
jgi:small-conductance mechanosensitive channel